LVKEEKLLFRPDPTVHIELFPHDQITAYVGSSSWHP